MLPSAGGDEADDDEDNATERTPALGGRSLYSDGSSSGSGELSSCRLQVAAVAGQQELRSPHGRAMKCLYGSSMISPWCAIIGVGVSRDIYSLKYGVDIGILGTLQLIHSALFVFSDVGIGYLQDKEKWLFSRDGGAGFSKARWGRRAPWHIVHCPLMALCMYLAWAPPSLHSRFLAGWYFLVMLVCSWCWQQITIATQAGAVECYPFKVERVVVEGFNVVFSSLGTIIAVSFIAVAYQFPLAEMPALRTTLGLLCGAAGLVSLPAAFALKDARQPSDASRVSFKEALRELSTNAAFRWMVGANVPHSTTDRNIP